MQGNVDFVAALAVLTIFGGPMVYFIANRVFTHQERMEMLRRGMAPPSFKGRFPAGEYVPGPMPVPPVGEPDPSAQAILRKGISIACIGLAIWLGLQVGLGSGPWILGGLIPMFVGIAQIIIAVMSGAQFGPARPQQAFGPPPTQTVEPQQQAAAGKPGPAGPPYGWRPPSGVTELERPPQPPDQR